MKKHVFLFSLFIMGAISSWSQTIIFQDDFESYTTGSKLVQSTTLTEWQTWSGGSGNSEDPAISDTYASQGTQSVKIIPNNDLVLHLGDKTTGRYRINFKILISSTKIGYFNLLNNFAGSSSVWAFQAYFKANGAGSVDAGAADAATFSYSYNTWHDVNIIVDVDDDFATFYFNGTEIVSWVFSKGTFGAGTLAKLDAVNFYGETGAEFFLDEVVVYEQPAITGPVNLQAVVNGNDIDLSWDAPSGPAPDSYVIVSNNTVLATGITTTTYTHLAPYPNTYTYVVKAHYNSLGYSQQSNDASAAIAGGVQRNYVLIEEGTGTWCPFCPGAAIGLEQLHSEGHDIAVIAYHEGDPYETSESLNRLSYYNITSYPSVVFDGGNLISGGHATNSMYPSYRPVYDEKILVPSLFSMSVDVEQTGDTTYAATIIVERHSEYYTGPFKLYGVVTESSIMVNWQNQNHLDFVFRKIFPSTSGLSVDFLGSTPLNATIYFEISSSWVKNNCEFIVFLQYDNNKSVLQADKVDMSTVIGVEEHFMPNIVVRPNPASDFVSVYADGLNKVSVMNMTGQTLMQQFITGNEAHMSIEHLPPGMYLVQVEAGNQRITRKLIVQ